VRTEYKQIVAHSMSELEEALNKEGGSGWQLHSWRPITSQSGIHIRYFAIMTRPERSR